MTDGPTAPATDRRRFVLVAGGIAVAFGLLLAGVLHVLGVRREKESLLKDLWRDVATEEEALAAEDVVPDAENAAPIYEKAWAKFTEISYGLTPKLRRDWVAIPGDLVEAVEKNAEAMEIAKAAAALPRCRFRSPPAPAGFREEPYGTVAQMDAYDQLPLAFAARARIRIEQGRTAEGVADALLVPGVIRHLLWRSIRDPRDLEWTLSRCVDDLLRALRRPDLDAATCRRVARELLEWPAIYAGESRRRRIEAILDEGWLAEILMGRMGSDYEANWRRKYGLPREGLLPWVSATDVDAVRRRREAIQALVARCRSGDFPSGPPGTHAGMLTVVRAAFAVRARQLESGSPPARVADLVPDLLPAVPADPFGGGVLPYEVRGDGWSVWSKCSALVPGAEPGTVVTFPLRVDWPPR